MTSTEKKFQLCFEACKAAAEWLNSAQKRVAYVVEPCGSRQFVVYGPDEECFYSWESFTDIVRGLRFSAYFGIEGLPSGDAHVAFFVYYV